MINMFTIQT